jgi:hypothetical protein
MAISSVLTIKSTTTVGFLNLMSKIKTALSGLSNLEVNSGIQGNHNDFILSTLNISFVDEDQKKNHISALLCYKAKSKENPEYLGISTQSVFCGKVNILELIAKKFLNPERFEMTYEPSDFIDEIFDVNAETIDQVFQKK